MHAMKPQNTSSRLSYANKMLGMSENVVDILRLSVVVWQQSQKGQTGQKVWVSSGKLLFKEEQVLNLCCDVLGTWGQNINHIT